MMKTKILILVLGALVASPALGQSLKSIERGATAAVRFYGEKAREMNADDLNEAAHFISWMSGFTFGLNMSAFITKEREGLDWATHPDGWMSDGEKSAPSFLAFIRKSKPDGFKYGEESNTPAQLFLAWYLTEHSKSNERARLTATYLLGAYFSELKTLEENLASASTDRERELCKKIIADRKMRKGEKTALH